MKVLFKFVFVALLFIFSTSCENEAQYHFIQSNDKIVGIELVSIVMDDDPMSPYRDSYKFTTIEAIPTGMYIEFIADFNSMNCYEYLNDPVSIVTGMNALKISYSNGDFELIGEDAQASSRGNKFRDYGFYYFDHDEFMELLNQYFQ